MQDLAGLSDKRDLKDLFLLGLPSSLGIWSGPWPLRVEHSSPEGQHLKGHNLEGV